ncbi:hypothetical protein LINPERHAP2_LOCUS12598 [Linum perenne]
MMELF